jgi:integrase
VSGEQIQTELPVGYDKENKQDQYITKYPALNKTIQYHLKEGSGSDSSIKKLKSDVLRLAEFAKCTPDELIKLEKTKLENIIREFLYIYTNKNSANSVLQTLKTFFRENDLNDLKYPHFHLSSRTRIKKMPITLEDAYKMVRFAPSIQAKLLILMLISTGMRISTILSIRFNTVKTNDPYLNKYTLLSEIDAGKNNIVIIIFQKMKELVNNACKCNIPYYVFMSEEASEALKDHKRILKSYYGSIENDDVLFPALDKHRGKCRKTPMTPNAVNKMLKQVAEKAGIPHWKKITAKSFRTLFENHMNEHGNDAGLEWEDREFLMGHVLPKPVENYYCPDKIEVLRKKYARIQFSPNLLGGIYQDLKHVADFFEISYDLVIEEAKLRYDENPEKHLIQRTLLDFLQKKREQKIINETELECHLKKGYRFINMLKDGRVIVEIDRISFKVNHLDNKEAT